MKPLCDSTHALEAEWTSHVALLDMLPQCGIVGVESRYWRVRFTNGTAHMFHSHVQEELLGVELERTTELAGRVSAYFVVVGGGQGCRRGLFVPLQLLPSV